MKKKSILTALSSVILAGYLIAALVWTARMSASQRCSGLDICIVDSVGHRFVTDDEIARELGALADNAAGRILQEIDIDSISRILNAIDKIESATVTRTSANRVNVKVSPMLPVARIWEHGKSYYINREGKRIGADARYHIDVPVIVGEFDSTFTAVSLIPLIDYIDADPTWSSLVTMIKVKNHNVYLLPMIRGHIINFGSTDRIADKFARLKAMYTDVLPVKGWDYYDTLSVKWDGQVVATRRHNKLPPPPFTLTDDSENEEGDEGTMSTEL